jgi:purine-nucleoside phosphorylase
VTNAAGSLNPDIPVGTIVAIHDHLSFPTLTTFPTSLQLPTPPHYSRLLRRLLFRGAHALHLPAGTLAEGTYCWVTGPTYETAAEGAFLRSAEGDVVGASTVPEVFAARRQGMEVLALSLVTNMVTMCHDGGVKAEVQAELVSSILPPFVYSNTFQAGLPTQLPGDGHVVSHSEVLETGIAKAEIVKALVISVVQSIP